MATRPPSAPTAMFIWPTPSVTICAKPTSSADAEAPQHHVDVELGEEVRREHGEHRGADAGSPPRGPTIRRGGGGEACSSALPRRAALGIDAAVAVDEHREEQDQAEEELQPEIADLQDEEAAPDGGDQRARRASCRPPRRRRRRGACRRAPAPRNEGSSHSSPPTDGIAAPRRATTIIAGAGGEHARTARG